MYTSSPALPWRPRSTCLPLPDQCCYARRMGLGVTSIAGGWLARLAFRKRTPEWSPLGTCFTCFLQPSRLLLDNSRGEPPRLWPWLTSRAYVVLPFQPRGLAASRPRASSLDSAKRCPDSRNTNGKGARAGPDMAGIITMHTPCITYSTTSYATRSRSHDFYYTILTWSDSAFCSVVIALHHQLKCSFVLPSLLWRSPLHTQYLHNTQCMLKLDLTLRVCPYRIYLQISNSSLTHSHSGANFWAKEKSI